MSLIITLLAFMFSFQQTNLVCRKKMKVEWIHEKDKIHFTLFAPTTGWVAIGFNSSDNLTGTNLIMGAMSNQEPVVDDRYIVKPGLHKKISDLGGIDNITSKHGHEGNGTTTIHFSLPIKSKDNYHFNLAKGQRIHLLMAYSQEDDFNHHSIMRTSLIIIL